jgi:hypothetical protein
VNAAQVASMILQACGPADAPAPDVAVGVQYTVKYATF